MQINTREGLLTVAAVLSGTSAPDNTLGTKGDLYFNTSTLVAYYKSDFSTWTLVLDGTLKRNVAFTQTVGTDWTGATATVQAALDQLAARVKVLGG